MENTKRKDDWSNLVQSQKSITAKNAVDEDKIESYYFIFNCADNTIEYVNNTFEILTGYPKDVFDINKLIAMIHPDDMDYFLQCEERGLNFTNTLSFSEHFRYLMSYTYRIKTADGSYIGIRQHCQAIEVNSQGHLTKTFVTHQRTSRDEQPLGNDYYIFDKDKNQKLNPNNFHNLTKREREILDLVQEGCNSTVIAEKLFCSKLTVDTHRRNILRKTNSKNFIDLLTKMSL